MLALSMMTGAGRPVYRTEINSNRNQWSFVSNGPSVPSVPIDFYLTIGPGVTVQANTFVPAIKLFALPEGSNCYLENNGTIRGWTTASFNKSSEVGCAIQASWNSGNIFIINGSGLIYAGDCADGVGYAVYAGGLPPTRLTWLSGSGRVYGTVVQT